MARLGAPLVVAVLAAIAIGALIGLSNGNTVARIGVNSLIVTLGVSTALLGVVEWYSKGQSIINHISKHLTNVGSGNWLGIPRTLYFLAVVAALVYYLLEHTPFGRYLHSIGSNEDAARLVGLRVERLVLLAFVLSGTLAGIAGVLLVARNGGASPQVGTVSDTLQALAAAFLGATAIKPGRFNVVGTLVAIFFLAFTVTGLSLAGVSNWINDVFNGAALFVAVLISTVIGRRRAGLA
jgi:ribose transport system permease protein